MSERLGELLVKAERITPEQLDMGLQNQRQGGGRLGSSLVELGFIERLKLKVKSSLGRDCCREERSPAKKG